MSANTTRALTLGLALSLGVIAFDAAPATADGINQLIQAQQLKTDNAAASATSSDELQQLHIQEQLARKTTTQQTSSNVLKKHADTQNAIIQNLK